MTSFETIRDDIATLVEDACKRETNISGYGIWTHHIQDVVKYSLMLTDFYPADREVVELAALLHDYAGISDELRIHDHHIAGSEAAEVILTGYNYPQDYLDLIKKCILNHRSSVLQHKISPEEICVASADGMAHIAQVPSLFYLVYKNHDMDIDSGRDWIKRKVEKDWNKICEHGKRIVGDEYQAIQTILKTDNGKNK